MIIKKQNFPIYAGMEFTYPGTKNNKLHRVGTKTVQFTFTDDGLLIDEKVIKKTFK